MDITLVAVDLSKSVFQVALADGQHQVLARKRLSRSQFHQFLAQHPPVQMVMEACGTAHYWGRTAAEYGHAVKLLHARYVRPYVRRTKTDAADADALVRADADLGLHPIPVKSVNQQAVQSLHRIREQWKRARTARINEARALLSEFGVVIPKGTGGLSARLIDGVERVPVLLQATMRELIAEIGELGQRLAQIDRTLAQYAKNDATAQLLLGVSGVGVITATAVVARVSNIHAFKRGRSFASWLGITAREHSSGSTRRLGRITKAGDRYLRTLFIHGARSALLAARRKTADTLTRLEAWAVATEQRIGHNRAAVALANKLARIVWAVWTRQIPFNGNDALRFAG